MVPGGVVPDVRFQERLHILDLARIIPELEMSDEPVAVCPDVIILGVLGKHLHQKVLLSGRKSWEMSPRRHENLAVVPYLIVLEMLQSDFIEPFNLLIEIFS
jgi:hypothetical protein